MTRWIRITVSVLAAAGVLGISLLAAGVFSRKPIAQQEEVQVERFSVEEIDHRTWDALLRRYVNEGGLVDYAGWKSNRSDIVALDDYLRLLSRADLKRDASRNARLAFWINAYNALTVRKILRDYQIVNVDKSNSLSQASEPSGVSLPVGESSFSLDEIEHEVLHVLNVPQAHFALVCGARGCPKLSNRAYTVIDLESRVEENAKAFFADPTKFVFDGDSAVQVSPILKWYADDSAKTPAEVLQAAALFLPADVRAKLQGQRKVRISYLDYDWSLNDQAAEPVAPPLPPEEVDAATSDKPLGPQ